MLILVINTPIPASIATVGSEADICISAPITMMLLIALVTLIKGVCNAAVTFQMTIYPMKHASTNTVKCVIKEVGATAPNP